MSGSRWRWGRVRCWRRGGRLGRERFGDEPEGVQAQWARRPGCAFLLEGREWAPFLGGSAASLTPQCRFLAWGRRLSDRGKRRPFGRTHDSFDGGVGRVRGAAGERERLGQLRGWGGSGSGGVGGAGVRGRGERIRGRGAGRAAAEGMAREGGRFRAAKARRMRSRRRGEGHCSRRRELADAPKGNGAGGQTIGEAARGAFCASAEGRGGERVAAFSERGAERVPAPAVTRQGTGSGRGGGYGHSSRWRGGLPRRWGRERFGDEAEGFGRSGLDDLAALFCLGGGDGGLTRWDGSQGVARGVFSRGRCSDSRQRDLWLSSRFT
jgi:hypothetical protein